MATIRIVNLDLAEEKLLKDLSVEETARTHGGWIFLLPLAVGSAAFGYAVGADDRRRATGC